MQIQPDASNPPNTPGVAGQRQQVTPMEGVDLTPAAASDSTIAACSSGDSTIIVELTAALKRQFESTSFQDSGGPSAKRQHGYSGNNRSAPHEGIDFKSMMEPLPSTSNKKLDKFFESVTFRHHQRRMQATLER
jgi:hypothetical protein